MVVNSWFGNIWEPSRQHAAEKLVTFQTIVRLTKYEDQGYRQLPNSSALRNLVGDNTPNCCLPFGKASGTFFPLCPASWQQELRVPGGFQRIGSA